MNARVTMQELDAGMPAGLFTPALAKAEERLPFTIRVASSEHQLHKAINVRHTAYGRHVPALGEMLRQGEAKDSEPGCVVLVAESKLDGGALGTMRIQTNHNHPLAIEDSVALPDSLAGCSLAEATRLGVAVGRVGRLVKTMLFKAFYMYCMDQGIEWIVIGARTPLDRMYEGLLFTDVFPGQGFFPLKHAGDLPHRILALEIDSADARWREARHPMYDLYVNTHHPDIEIRGTGIGIGYGVQHAAVAMEVAA